jgi:hypothetical protein
MRRTGNNSTDKKKSDRSGERRMSLKRAAISGEMEDKLSGSRRSIDGMDSTELYTKLNKTVPSKSL